MNLGDLEFKAEDFFILETDKALTTKNEMLWFQMKEEFAKRAAEDANRILREKLAKAPEVFGFRDGSGRLMFCENPVDNSGNDHRASLVCIEEVGK